MNKNTTVTVIGAGRWGTAMAIYFDSIGLSVNLCFSSKSSYHYAKEKGHSKRLPQFEIPSSIQLYYNLKASLENVEYVVVSIPVVFLSDFLEKNFHSFNPATKCFIGINKGIESDSLRTPYDIFHQFFPNTPYAQIGGPCFPAGLILKKNPAAEVISATDEKIALEIQKLFSTPAFRLYISPETPANMAILGALKNVYAIAAGIISSLHLSEESNAILITRGLAEIKRLMNSIDGISHQSIYGLGGLGDLILTCYSSQSSQNKLFGQYVAQEKSVEDAILRMDGKECEGYFTCKALYQMIQKYNIEMPIASAVYQVLYERKSVKTALRFLMERQLTFED